MKYLSARRAKRDMPLTGPAIHKVMRCLYPRRNDYGTASFDELVPELTRFGVITVGRFERLMKRHRRQLLVIDQSPMNTEYIEFARECGADIKDAVRRDYWFAYPALVRTAAELEWGEAAAMRENR